LHIGDNLGDIGDKYENTYCRSYAADNGIEFCFAYHAGKSPFNMKIEAVDNMGRLTQPREQPQPQ
jgi:hypothetical protein